METTTCTDETDNQEWKVIDGKHVYCIDSRVDNNQNYEYIFATLNDKLFMYARQNKGEQIKVISKYSSWMDVKLKWCNEKVKSLSL